MIEQSIKLTKKISFFNHIISSQIETNSKQKNYNVTIYVSY